VAQHLAQRLTSIIVLTIASTAFWAPARAATFTVNVTDDGVDADPTDGLCDAGGGRCTLRAAVQQANVTVDADTIILPVGLYRLTLRGEDDVAASGDLDIASDVTIEGAGPISTIIDGRKAKDRIFEILGNATIRGVTLRGGRVNRKTTGGGAIRNHDNLVLENAVITRCKALDDGGAIDMRGGHMTLRDVVIRGNKAGDDAGGLDIEGGIAELTRVLIERNRAGDETGGLENSGATVFLTDSQVMRNRARSSGGGLTNEDGGTMWLSGCVVAGNRAKVGGGLSTFDVALGQNTTMVRDTSITQNRRRNCRGTLTSLGGNADDDASCGF